MMVVGPGYYLVCYNAIFSSFFGIPVVGPGYYLVCYNNEVDVPEAWHVVGPGYYLVCYNRDGRTPQNPMDCVGFFTFQRLFLSSKLSQLFCFFKKYLAILSNLNHHQMSFLLITPQWIHIAFL